MKKIICLLTAAVLASGACLAQTIVPLTGLGHTGGPYNGPKETVSTVAYAWWGFRAYSRAGANSGPSTTKVMDVLGATTVTGCTVFLKGDGTGDIDLTTSGAGGVGNQCASGATTFCTVTNTSCSISKMYDQSGNTNCTTACNASNATAANQPTLTFSCIGTKACSTWTSASSQILVTPNTSLNEGVTSISYSWVAKNNTSAGVTRTVFGINGTTRSQTGYDASANNTAFVYGGGAGVYPATATSGVLDAISTVNIDLNHDAINVNGVDTSDGVNTGIDGLGSGNPITLGGAATISNFISGTLAEAGIWGNFALTSGNRTALCQNQQHYYGPSNFGATC
jgi:hypothetical protein